MTRQDIKELLRDSVAEISFTKKDGTERIMKCTLQSNLIPEEHTPKGTSTAKENLDIINVFDLDKIGWRSFLVDNVQYVKTAH
jgi:hypothetical protein